MRTCSIEIVLILTIFVSGCVSLNESERLSIFEEDKIISGKVIENNKRCVVDLDCDLKIEFSDKTIRALYGTGERPAPTCDITAEVSNLAFDVKKGDIIDAVISGCGSEGYFIKQIDTHKFVFVKILTRDPENFL